MAAGTVVVGSEGVSDPPAVEEQGEALRRRGGGCLAATVAVDGEEEVLPLAVLFFEPPGELVDAEL